MPHVPLIRPLPATHYRIGAYSMDSVSATQTGICWSTVCNGECGKLHADTSVPERPVHWSWLPAIPKPRYMGQWWSRGSVDSLMHASGRGDLDVDDMSNES